MNRKQPKPEWRGFRTATTVEYRSDPSVLAQERWLHVLCMGKARVSSGFEHKHQDRMAFLLHYIRRGSMTHVVSNHIHKVDVGHVCLMSLDRPVRYRMERGETGENWWILFGGRDVPRMMRELKADEDPVFALPDVRRFEHMFRDLTILIRDRPVAYQARSFGILALMFAEFFAARGGMVESEVDLVGRKGSSLSEPILNAVRRIGRFYNETLPLQHICDATNLSLSHFVRQFHRETGMSPMRYVTRYRIEKAKELLSTTDYSIGEVARMVGIPDQYTFARTFRKFTGQTPTTYRAQSENES